MAPWNGPKRESILTYGNTSLPKECMINKWNLLPKETVTVNNVKSFKRNLQKMYTDGSFQRLLYGYFEIAISLFQISDSNNLQVLPGELVISSI